MSLVSVEEGYARWAPTYDSDPNPLLTLEERYLRPRLLPVKGKQILDLACGTGRWSKWLIEHDAGCVVGVDLSRAMLAEANSQPALRGRLALAHACHLPLRHNAFDLVLCSFALGHIEDLDALAREVVRVTTPNAYVYVSDLHESAYAAGWKTGFRDMHGLAEITTRPRPLCDQLVAWSSAGFRCTQRISGALGDAERPILDSAGKAAVFNRFYGMPAIQICQFQRSSAASPREHTRGAITR